MSVDAMNDTWPAERIERLRLLVATGMSSKSAGIELGCSRNAVVGKCRRMGFPLLTEPVGGVKRLRRKGKPPLPPREPHLTAKAVVRRMGPVSLPALASVPVPLPEPPAPAVAPRLMTGQCCYPEGELRTRGFRYCDAPCELARSYCDRHHEVTHIKRKPRELVE